MKGIYRITNQITGAVYIGQSIDMEKRWEQHKAAARKKPHSMLYAAINKYGVDNFSFEPIEIITDLEDLDEAERRWIKYYRERAVCYNRKAGGQRLPKNAKDLSYVSPVDRRLHNQLQALRERDKNEI